MMSRLLAKPILKKGGCPMNNNYEIAEIVEIGKAHDVILGSSKDVLLFDDSPQEGLRETPVADDE
jgi:hypothetical protein